MYMATSNILILGAGAIGSNLVRLLAADLQSNYDITALDKDIVEERNIIPGTQFYTQEDVGMPKVEALQFNIHRQHGKEINIIHSEFNIGNNHLLDGFHYIVDCFDNSQSRRCVQNNYRLKLLRADGCQLLHVGFSEHFTYAIEWDRNYTPPSDITFDICEHPGAASFVNRVAADASWVLQEAIIKGTLLNVIGNRGSLQTYRES